ncbi:MAG TPA: AbrB/MazE/SpoVT family DNA-binding domain-containing protein [Thermoanaerobaculia bacterium]|nr:AbrB/MazE/SpoVT family DNA-binding domain-containing protein [Thermoanaerobaculia bacterium]
MNDREFSVRLSTKGQLVIPREIRDRHGWSEGVELVLADQGDSVVLRSVRPFPETTLEELVGCTGYKGPAMTLDDMEAGIARGAWEHR